MASASAAPASASAAPFSASAAPASASAAPSSASAASTAITALPDLSRNGWASKNASKWECQRGATGQTRQAPSTNLFLADEFDKLAEHYKSCKNSKDDEWKAFSCSKAAKAIRGLSFEVRDASDLVGVKGIGGKTRQKAHELLTTGKLRRLESLQGTPRSMAMAALTKVHGVGAATAEEWFRRGITTVDEAISAGVLNAQQRVGAKYWRDLEVRIPRAEVSAIVEHVRDAAHAALRARGVAPHTVADICSATGAGSYRRGKPTSGDCDVLICRHDGGPDAHLIADTLATCIYTHISIHAYTCTCTHAGGPDAHLIADTLAELARAGCVLDHLTHDEIADEGVGGATAHSAANSAANSAATLRSRDRWGSCHSYRGVIRLRGYEHFRRLDLKVYPPEEFAFALLYFTGSDHFNRSMRHYAKARGYSLSDHGIVHCQRLGGGAEDVRGTRNIFPDAKCEADVFAALGLQYVEPTLRDTTVTPLPAKPLLR